MKVSATAIFGRTCWYGSSKLGGMRASPGWCIGKRWTGRRLTAYRRASRSRSTSWKISTSYTFAPLSLRKAGLAGVTSSTLDPCDALLQNAGRATDKYYGVTIAMIRISARNDGRRGWEQMKGTEIL